MAIIRTKSERKSRLPLAGKGRTKDFPSNNSLYQRAVIELCRPISGPGILAVDSFEIRYGPGRADGIRAQFYRVPAFDTACFDLPARHRRLFVANLSSNSGRLGQGSDPQRPLAQPGFDGTVTQ